MKNIMIINWRWDNWNNDKIKKINVENSAGLQLIGLKYYAKKNTESFNVALKNIINQDDNNILILLHRGNGITQIDEFLKSNRRKMFPFGGEGTDEIYNNDSNPSGILGIRDIAKSALCDGDNTIKKENFEFVWDYYWNKLDLEYQKKTIINLWLPLAIDIQGLSEVGDNEAKAKKYFEEIKKENNCLTSLIEFPKEEDFPRWEEIKNSLEGEYKNFTPSDLVNDILSANDYNSFKSNENKYLDSKINNKPNPTYLPNWLQEVVRILDDKINPSDDKK